LFIDLGGAPGLGRLAGYVETLWDSPADRQDLRKRVEWVAHARTDEVRLIALCSIRERPPGTTDHDVERAGRVCTLLLEVPHLGPAAAAALGVLQNDPPEAAGAKRAGQGKPNEAFPTTRLGLRWHLWRARLRGWLARRRA
jgi:hypothetical protein